LILRHFRMTTFAMGWGGFSIPYFRLDRLRTARREPGNGSKGICNGILPGRINKYVIRNMQSENMEYGRRAS
jgi:hypothetical protein